MTGLKAGLSSEGGLLTNALTPAVNTEWPGATAHLGVTSVIVTALCRVQGDVLRQVQVCVCTQLYVECELHASTCLQYVGDV